MGIQDRDYYRDELRHRQGYVERSRFRKSLGQSNTDSAGWLAFFGWFVLAVAVAACLLFAIRRVL